MKQKSVLIFAFFVISFGSSGQSIYEGTIKDSKTQVPLAYVNIGIVGKNVGTVSDSDGQFRLAIDDKHDDDTMKISMIGYKSVSMKVADFGQQIRENPVISLKEEPYTLEEVVVSEKKYNGRKLREKLLGNEVESTNSRTGFDMNLLGNEMGIVIKIKKKPTFIQEFSIGIAENKYDSFKFRINIYNVKDGLPDQNILQENIIVTSDLKEGKLTVDLSKYHIMVEDDIFVAMEWIEDMGDYGLLFSTKVNGRTSPTIVRKTSQGHWRRIGKNNFMTNGIGILIRVLQ